MDLGLQGKKAFIAASSTGLGYAVALELAREKAQIILTGHSEERLEIAKKRLTNEVPSVICHTHLLDLYNETQIKTAIALTANTLGGIDLLITNAPGPKAGAFGELNTELWHSAFNMTLMSAVHLIAAARPYLEKSTDASILTITSTSGKQPLPGLFLSNVFRPAVLGLTKALSIELAPHNIRVNSILPGWTATERSKELLKFYAETNKHSEKEEVERIASDIPLKRIANPEEFAKAATFLVSPAASYITGVMFAVDGGRYRGVM